MGFSPSLLSFSLLIIILTYHHPEMCDSIDLAAQYYICCLHTWDLTLTWLLAVYQSFLCNYLSVCSDVFIMLDITCDPYVTLFQTHVKLSFWGEHRVRMLENRGLKRMGGWEKLCDHLSN